MSMLYDQSIDQQTTLEPQSQTLTHPPTAHQNIAKPESNHARKNSSGQMGKANGDYAKQTMYAFSNFRYILIQLKPQIY